MEKTVQNIISLKQFKFTFNPQNHKLPKDAGTSFITAVERPQNPFSTC